MKVEELEDLQKKIAKAKESKSRAEGALEKIREDLKKEFDVSTVGQAEEKVKILTKELEADEEKLEALLDKIDKSVDWDKI